MKGLIRESVKALEGETADKLIPITGAAPHYVSLSKAHPENGLTLLFPVEIDGKIYYVYMKQ